MYYKQWLLYSSNFIFSKGIIFWSICLAALNLWYLMARHIVFYHVFIIVQSVGLYTSFIVVMLRSSYRILFYIQGRLWAHCCLYEQQCLFKCLCIMRWSLVLILMVYKPIGSCEDHWWLFVFVVAALWILFRRYV